MRLFTENLRFNDTKSAKIDKFKTFSPVTFTQNLSKLIKISNIIALYPFFLMLCENFKQFEANSELLVICFRIKTKSKQDFKKKKNL